VRVEAPRVAFLGMEYVMENALSEWRRVRNVSVDRAASLLGVTSATVRRWGKKWVLPAPIVKLIWYLYRDTSLYDTTAISPNTAQNMRARARGFTKDSPRPSR
jgi:hypothetical protein